MKTFKFRIEKDDFIKEIKIDTNRIKNSNDLSVEISKQFKLDLDQFEFENSITKEIKEYENGFKFKLKLKNTSSVLNFQLPDGKNHIQIKNSPNLTFKDIKTQIKQDKTHFYSPLCVEKNFNYYLFGIEILYQDVKKNFINLPPNKSYEIKLKGNYVEFEVYDKKFTFSENEKIFDASSFSENEKIYDVSSLIKKKFGLNQLESYVEILRDSQSGKRILCSNDVLHKGDVFKSLLFEVSFQFDFNSKNYSQTKKFDIYNTIENVLQFSALIYSSNTSQLKAEDIVLQFINNKTKKKENIANLQSKLIDFYDGKGIAFYIDIITGKSIQINDNQNNKKQQNATFGQLVLPQTNVIKESPKQLGYKKEIPKTPDNKKEIPKTTETKKEIPKTTDNKKEIPKTPETKKEIPKTPDNKKEIPKTPDNKKEIPKSTETKKEIQKTPDNKKEIPKSTETKKDIRVYFNCKNGQNFHLVVSPNDTIADIVPSVHKKVYFNEKLVFMFDENSVIKQNLTFNDIKEKIYDKKLKMHIICVDTESNHNKQKAEEKRKPAEKPNPKLTEKPKEKQQTEKPNPKLTEKPKEKQQTEKPKDLKERNIQSSSRKLKYWYQNLNESDIINEIDLDPTATVKTLKMEIKKKYKVKNIYDIKVLFAGKDLLDDIILEKLNVGSTILFVYIRTPEDILLMTAKALRIEPEFEEEEEVSDD